jgi:periplasmic divalent cation tolerance protein
VFTTLPTDTDAHAFLRPLLESRLIACGSVLAPVRSVFRWDGAVTEAVEQQVLLETTASRLQRLRDDALTRHPYEVPEWLVVPVTDGLPAYLDWVRAETGTP